ncbi:hypothetical protein [Flavobacterium pedocola]
MGKVLGFFEKQSKTALILSLLLFIYWLAANLIENVYEYAVVGAIFELLWFPFLILLFVLPVLNLIMLIKNNFNYRKLWLYALLINGLTVFYLFKMFG